MKVCPKCGAQHCKPGTFCSRTCANSHSRTDESKKKTSESVKKYASSVDKDVLSKRALDGWENNAKKKHGPFTPITFRHCNYCGTYFTAAFDRTWCTDECFFEIKRKNWQGNKQRFRDQNFDSSWEIEMVKWFEENEIQFQTKPNSIEWIDKNGKSHKYFPDFYLPILNLYVDPKNKIVAKMQKEKLDIVSRKINLIYGELEYIKEQILMQL